MNDVIDQLMRPEVLASRREVIGRSSVVPPEPGIYAWYFRELPSSSIEEQGCWQWQSKKLLYTGISPSAPPRNGKPPSTQNIRKRIAYHMRGNAYGSTLRLSIGCLLADSIGIQLRRVGSGDRLTFADGESLLSEWLDENAYVTWVTHPQPWLVETEAISRLYLPLNLDQNSSHPFHGQLSAARKSAKAIAMKLPIVKK
jgi:hypothetical protein